MLSIFKTTKNNNELLDTISAFHIWNMAKSRYSSLLTFKFMRGFIHDRDFYVLASKYVTELEGEAKTLEELAKKFQIILPERPPVEMVTSGAYQGVTDRAVYKMLFENLSSELYSLARAFATCTTNDSLREQLIYMFYQHLDFYGDYIKYGKIKGWQANDPVYVTAKPTRMESISLSEANHLWDHLNERYDEIKLTQFFLEVIHDKDFSLLLKRGLTILENQTKELENKLIQYDVPLAVRPPAFQETVVDLEVIDDKYIYRYILSGMQGALNLHFRAVIECLRNDSLRTFFTKLMKTEIELYDNVLKYGKVKGWTKVPPMYVNKK